MPANDGKISGLTRVSGLDRANDLFEVDHGGASKSATVNDMLGLTSAPLGTTEVQSPTNKTFDNTNVFTVKDTNFTLQDDGDTTKQARFQLSGITTGQTRVYTLPNANGTLVDLASSQTLTGKTLTSPVINTPTINNPTLNTDSISEFTNNNGVTVDGLNIMNGKLNTNNSVITANVTDAAITPAKLIAGTGAGWPMQTYTATLANITLGTGGTQACAYIQIGKLVFVDARIILGTSGVFTGNVTISLPVAANSRYSSGTWTVGAAWLDDSGIGNYQGLVVLQGTTVAALGISGSAATYVSPESAVNATVPFTWGVADSVNAQFWYEAA